MTLNLLSPTSTKKIEVNWLEAQTKNGSYVILPGHAPMILILEANKKFSMQFKDGSKTDFIIAGGILEINRNEATLFLTHE